MFGAVGDGERLEFTVIGDAVNFAAKLEKHNKDEKTRAVVDGGTYALAEQQGYVAPAVRERRPGRQVGGVADLVDIVVLARRGCATVDSMAAAVALPFPHSGPM